MGNGSETSSLKPSTSRIRTFTTAEPRTQPRAVSLVKAQCMSPGQSNDTYALDSD